VRNNGAFIPNYLERAYRNGMCLIGKMPTRRYGRIEHYRHNQLSPAFFDRSDDFGGTPGLGPFSQFLDARDCGIDFLLPPSWIGDDAGDRFPMARDHDRFTPLDLIEQFGKAGFRSCGLDVFHGLTSRFDQSNMGPQATGCQSILTNVCRAAYLSPISQETSFTSPPGP
jgi:hypothetical protein